MGLIETAMGLVFGSGRNVVAETAEVFRVNAEAEAQRGHGARGEALEQFAAEFARAQGSGFDRMMDGVNRLPRPAMALGTLGLFGAAMVDPVWFAERMAGIALVPEPLWWLLAAIVSFYFGARHQAKGQDFQREMAVVLSRLPQIRALLDGSEETPAPDAVDTGDNTALAEWRATQG
ncbi:holin family protein [Litorisediminicola beolgyonensis]|uniref:Holin family protein n=1 Tax=Litorisediminicola beolgyonensis TaxID=1173614 RepID=A0ABW3ZFQ6_9RHOB